MPPPLHYPTYRYLGPFTDVAYSDRKGGPINSLDRAARYHDTDDRFHYKYRQDADRDFEDRVAWSWTRWNPVKRLLRSPETAFALHSFRFKPEMPKRYRASRILFPRRAAPRARLSEARPLGGFRPDFTYPFARHNVAMNRVMATGGGGMSPATRRRITPVQQFVPNPGRTVRRRAYTRPLSRGRGRRLLRSLRRRSRTRVSRRRRRR